MFLHNFSEEHCNVTATSIRMLDCTASLVAFAKVSHVSALARYDPRPNVQ